jgi:hypothetical protein
VNTVKCISAAVLVLSFSAFILPRARACTIFSYSQHGNVLVGNNEDVPFLPQAAMWFVPDSTNGYGRVCFGWDSGAQGGMNDQGLFIDCNCIGVRSKHCYISFPTALTKRIRVSVIV